MRAKGVLDPLRDNRELDQCATQLLEATFQVLQTFKAASKYHIHTLSEGTVYLLHGSVVRVSQLFGEELELMI